MRVHEVRVMRKGCKGENTVTVVIQDERIAVAQQQKMVDSFSTDQVVFISNSAVADSKVDFYVERKQVRICFICISAAIQVLLRNFPDKYKKNDVSLETNEDILKIDTLFTKLSKKEYHIIDHIKSSNNRDIHYWKHNLAAYNGYSKDKILIEAPGTPFFLGDFLTIQKIVNPTLVPFDTIDDFLYETLTHKASYRIQLKYEENSCENMFLIMYLQNLTQGQIIRLEYFLSYLNESVSV